MASKSTVSTTIQLLGELDPSVQKVFAKAQDLATKAGSAIGKAMSTGFKVAGTAAVAAAGYMAKIGTEYQAATGQIAAATGATGEELEALQGVMQEVYGNNYGDSMEDVASAVATVKQQMQGLSDEGLQSVTEGAFLLRDTFQYDVSESVRAANALVKNFGIDGDDAMNLIAAGAQNGLDFSGELLDTISEYSVQFSKVGIDADQMFQIMQAGADSGAWNLDKVGDAIKEMSIRVVDGSETTAQGFEAIGLNADEMAQAFAAGGDSAQKAFRDTIKGLAEMEDPVEQNIAGVNLFGTMWEDLGPEVVEQLASITDEAYAAGDELSNMADVKYDNLWDALQGLGRTLETELMPLASELTGFLTDIVQNIDLSGVGEKLSEAFTAVVDYVKPILEPLQRVFDTLFSSDVFGGIAEAIQPILGPLQALAIALTEGIAGAFENMGPVFDALQQAFSGIMTFLTPVLDGLKQGVEMIFPAVVEIGNQMAGVFQGVLETLWPMLEPLGQLVGSLFPALVSILSFVGQAFVAFQQLIQPVWQAIMTAIMPVLQSIIGALQGLLDFIINVFTGNWQGAWDAVVSMFGNIWSGIVGLVKAPINAVIGIINSAISAINGISVDIPDWVPIVGGQHFGFNIPTIPMLATGGTITEPMLAVVGDAPETIVPHGDTPRNRALLGEAAAGVGASVGGTVVNFNVTITGGNAEDVRQGILEAEDEFERRMDAYFARKARVSFAL